MLFPVSFLAVLAYWLLWCPGEKKTCCKEGRILLTLAFLVYLFGLVARDVILCLALSIASLMEILLFLLSRSVSLHGSQWHNAVIMLFSSSLNVLTSLQDSLISVFVHTFLIFIPRCFLDYCDSGSYYSLISVILVEGLVSRALLISLSISYGLSL